MDTWTDKRSETNIPPKKTSLCGSIKSNVFHANGFQLPVPSQFWEIIGNTNMISCFSKLNSVPQGLAAHHVDVWLKILVLLTNEPTTLIPGGVRITYHCSAPAKYWVWGGMECKNRLFKWFCGGIYLENGIRKIQKTTFVILHSLSLIMWTLGAILGHINQYVNWNFYS